MGGWGSLTSPRLISDRRSPLAKTTVRRDHLSAGQPYKAGPKAAEAGPKKTHEDPLGIPPERLSFRASSGAVSRALGPAL